MTREEKLQFIEEMEREEREQQAKDSMRNYVKYAECIGRLPPSGDSEEDKARREEWKRSNLSFGSYVQIFDTRH